jgi:PAS domain S-box-containing protein
MFSRINTFLSWVSEQGIRPDYSLGKKKYMKLVNQLSLLVAGISVLFLFISYPQEAPTLLITKWAAPFAILSVIGMNRLGHPKTAKVVFYLLLNSYCFVLGLFVGVGSGAHLFFIPIIFGSALVFDMRRLGQRLWVLSVPLATILCLWLLGDTFAPDAVRFSADLQQTYLLNYSVTIFASFLLAYLYFRVTSQQQRQLSAVIHQLGDLNAALTEKERSLQHNLQYSDMLLENLKASKDYFQSVIQNANDIICITDGKGMIKYVTPSFYRLTGYSAAEFRNKVVFDLIHPDDISYCQERFFLRVSNAIPAQTVMFRCQKADGTYLFLEANGNNLLENKAVGGIVINARDVTERVRFERQLIRKEDNMRSILDNSPLTIWLVDVNYHLLDYNKAFAYRMQQKFGITLTRGLNLSEVFPEEVVTVWKERYAAALTGKREVYYEEMEIDGENRLYQVRVFPIQKGGEADRFTVLAEDISLQKQAEQALIEAKEKAEEATRIKAQFLSTMSHEIRTPMNAVIGMSHLLMQDNPRPDQHENIRLLRFSAENLLALINDVLDFNKLEAGKVVFEKALFDLPQLLDDLKNSMQTVAGEKGLRLESRHGAGVPQKVVGDSVRLSQVLSNLLSNAIKFTQTGYVRLATQLIEEKEAGWLVHFSVEDSGIGIAPDKLDVIFESFTQAETDTTRRFGGTGLGLSITKHLLAKQGSQITVKSSPGQGSTFSFELFFDKELHLLAPMQTVHLQTSSFLDQARILLVEDNPLNRFVAEKFLLRWGLEVEVAECGLEALDMLQAKPFSLVLMDLQLPDIDGFEVVEKLRASACINTAVPVLAMSASTEPHIQAQAFAAGMQDFVVKPFDPESLREKINSYIRTNRLAQVGS